MAIDIDGDVIDEITIDGQSVEEVTVNGNAVFRDPKLGSSLNPATSAQEIIDEGDDDGDGVYFIQGVGEVFCDMTTDGGGWMHAATFQDSGSIPLGGDGGGTESQHPWGYGLHHENDSQTLSNNSLGVWGDDSSISGNNDPQSFESDFKNGALWSQNSFSQILMKNNGSSLNNLWYTQSGEVNTNYSNSLQQFFQSGGIGGDVWRISSDNNDDRDQNTSGSYGKVRYNVNKLGGTDDIFGSNYNNINMFFGETDSQEANNNDRSMFTRGSNSSVDVSKTQGIGVSRIGDGNDKWRDIDPQFRDSPGNISNTYNYTMWIR